MVRRSRPQQGAANKTARAALTGARAFDLRRRAPTPPPALRAAVAAIGLRAESRPRTRGPF